MATRGGLWRSRSVRLLAAGGAAAIVLAAFFIRMPAGAGAADNSGTDPNARTGRAYAEALNLPIVSSAEEIASCDGGIVELDGDAYCIGLREAPRPVDRWQIAQQIRGHVPTDYEIQVFEAHQAFVEAVDEGRSEAEILELRREFDDLVANAP